MQVRTVLRELVSPIRPYFKEHRSKLERYQGHLPIHMALARESAMACHGPRMPASTASPPPPPFGASAAAPAASLRPSAPR